MIENKNSIWNNILNLLFPERIKCIVCGCELSSESEYSICDEYYKNLPWTLSHNCKKCGESLMSLADYCMSCKNHVERYFEKARSPFMYDGAISKLLLDLKFNNKKYIGKYLSEFLVDEYIKNNFDCDIVVPIPITKKRLRERGYNQSLLLCSSFETKLNMKVVSANFVKYVDTVPQVDLNSQDRKKNLINTFKVVNKAIFKNKKVLLIDDIFTTGSTMEEASKMLLKAGAKEIYCLSVAHTMPPAIRKKQSN